MKNIKELLRGILPYDAEILNGVKSLGNRRGKKMFTVHNIFLILILALMPFFGLNKESTRTAAAQISDPYEIFIPLISKITVPILSGDGDWPMAGANPQRTSWTATEVKGQLKAEWFTHFDAYISQKVQIIAASNKIFISAADGLHTLDSNSGAELWFFPTTLPPGNSPTFHNNVVYLGGLDHNLYALDADNGELLWSFTAGAGFETNPLVIDQVVYAGNRDGYFYAIRTNGQLAWRYKTNGPILFSAAAQDGVVYFASNDMYAYALSASNGNLVWKSAKLPGVGFQSWWPVIYQNYVVFSGSWIYRHPAPFPNSTPTLIDIGAYPANAAVNSTIGAYGTASGNWAAGTTTMNASRISQYLEANPHRRTTVYLNRSNGSELTYDSDSDGRPEYAPFLFSGTQSGNRYPPVVGSDNVIYQANNYVYNSIPRGHVTGWKLGTTTISIPTAETNAIDEPMGYAIGGSTVYWKRCCDRKAGSFSLSGGSNVIYYDEGSALRKTLPDLFALGWDFSYWKHGDTTPPIPYNGRVYMINNNAVVAFSTTGKNKVLPDNEDRGVATGVQAASIERANTVTGLNTKVTLNNNSWPLLIQQERYYEFREELTTRANYFSLFEVAGSTGSNPSTLNTTNANISTTLVSTFDGSQTLRTLVASRTPTILFQNTSAQYMLKGKLAAFSYQSGAGTQVRSGNVTIAGSELSEGWLLVWDTTTNHRWAPIVLSLQNRPTQIRLDASGLLLSFSGASGYLGVTPLYGMSAPKTNEVTTWPGGIPQGTVERVRLINRIARSVPTSSTETLTIDAPTGDGIWDYSYQNTTFTDAWNTSTLQLAYLPPQMALAAWNGSPIRINDQPFENITDLAYLTPIGRVAGVPNANAVRVRLPGIANYWRQQASLPPAPGAGDPLQAVLVAEVQKIIQAGHLLPAYGKNGLWDSKASNRLGHYLSDYFHNPAETVYTLIRALPLLPASLQTQVRQYLTNEFASYPTYAVSHVGWDTGTPREAFSLPPEVMAAKSGFPACGVCNDWGIPGENHYASWLYAANLGNAASIYSNTVSVIDPAPQFQQSMPYALNNQIAGYIGYLRLAQLANAGTQTAAEKTMVNLLVVRAALSKYPSALQETGFEYSGYKWSVRTYAPNMPDTLFSVRTMGTLWSQTPLYGYPTDLLYGLSGPGTGGAYVFGIDYLNMVPEQAQFMRDYTLNEEQDAISEYERRTPYWFVSEAEEGTGEGVVHPLYDTIALFQAKAMILQASRSELELYLDVPSVPIGDLYYIQRLILILDAN